MLHKVEPHLVCLCAVRVWPAGAPTMYTATV
jgi:hypothetical protein